MIFYIPKLGFVGVFVDQPSLEAVFENPEALAKLADFCVLALLVNVIWLDDAFGFS